MTAHPKPPANSRPTFLFTDIVDSSKMASAFGHTAYVEKLQRPHDVVLRAAIEKCHGYADGTAGDSFFVVFDRAEDALNCAREMQERLHETPITAVDVNGSTHTLAVRIGVHTAEHEVSFDEETHYRSQPDVNFAARIIAQAGAGQILVSAETHARAGNAAACKWQAWPDRWIKSFEDTPQTLYEFLWDNGETRGEPGLRWLPATFRNETDRYIPRPELQERILEQYRQPKNNGVQARMVTLVGYGGMGKTRLAVACALQALGVFTHGVIFVPLADRQPSAQTLVEAIGAAIKESKFAKLDELLPERPAKLEDLPPALREKFVLLVLDNSESVHCPEVQKFLRDLLQETRHLRLLVTGREAVNLHPLEKQIEVEGLTPEQATELFVDRARRQRGRDAWTPRLEQEHQALRDILRLTERIPLAIELVAAWMGLREIGRIAEELEKTPLPTLPPGHEHSDSSLRHRSLLRSLNYSYNRLDDPLKYGLAVLSLFADTFDAGSATEACALTRAQGVLDRLYEKSLITRSADAEGRSRYAMLRPTRAYAAERRTALPDTADLQVRYIAYYRQLAKDNHGINDLGKLAVLEREWRNALAAADLAEAVGDTRSLNILSEYLGDFLLLRGWWLERERLNGRALEAARIGGDRQAEGRSLGNLGIVYQEQGKWQEAIDCYEQDLSICREYSDRVGEGQTLNNLGIVYQEQGKWQEAIDCYEQSLALFREYGDRVGEGKTLGNLGLVYQAQGKWQEAIDCYEQSLVIKREYSDRVGEGQTLGNIALLYDAQGDTAKALEWELEALQVLEMTQDRRAIEKARRRIAEWEKAKPRRWWWPFGG